MWFVIIIMFLSIFLCLLSCGLLFRVSELFMQNLKIFKHFRNFFCWKNKGWLNTVYEDKDQMRSKDNFWTPYCLIRKRSRLKIYCCIETLFSFVLLFFYQTVIFNGYFYFYLQGTTNTNKNHVHLILAHNFCYYFTNY